MTELYRLPGRPISVSLRLPPNMQVVLPGSRIRTGFLVNVLCDTIIMVHVELLGGVNLKAQTVWSHL